MNRKLWSKRKYSSIYPVEYPCPKCNDGLLKLHSQNTEITASGQVHKEIAYPYGIEHILAGILKCSNSRCQENVAFCGELFTEIEVPEEAENGVDDDEYNLYKLKFFYPNLQLFPLNEKIPDNIREQINLSFSHYFNDLSSCANAIRTSIELILDDIGAPKFKYRPDRSKHFFTKLHGRIDNLRVTKRNITLSKLLLAIKIIGNEGSHAGETEVNDILDAYEILVQVLDLAYIKSRTEVLSIANEITQSNKPRSKQEN